MNAQEIKTKYCMGNYIQDSGVGAKLRKKEKQKAEIESNRKLLQKIGIKVEPDGTFTPNGRQYYKVTNATFLDFKKIFQKKIDESLKSGKPISFFT